MGYSVKIFIDTKFYCLKRQFFALYQMASLPLSKYCMKSLYIQLIGDHSSKQQDKVTAMVSTLPLSGVTAKVSTDLTVLT